MTTLSESFQPDTAPAYIDLEIELLFEAMFRRYSFDFRDYAYDSAKRRVILHLSKHHINSIAELQHKIIYHEQAADELLIDLSINVTEMFRDPLFFKSIREQILVKLGSQDHIKIWHAGCSSGEESYSMAIFLYETGLIKRSQIYATDFNNKILDKAKQGILDLKFMRTHITNYQNAGGTEEFTDYYQADHQHAILKKFIKEPIIFSNHNLTRDSSFGEMQLIICRNVLIYFDKKLQEQVFKLFAESLAVGGFLCLGSHETLSFSSIFYQFETVSEKLKIYQKISEK